MDDREHRRRPDPSRRPLGRSSDPRDSDDFVLGRDGKPLVDRYGRPVRRRPQRPPRREPQRPPRREATPAPEARPRQHMPPRPRPQAPARHTPPPAAPPRTRRRKPRSTGGPLRMLGWIMAVVLVLAVSMMLWADAQLNRVQALPDARVANTAGTNWLLVGSDSRQGMSEEDAERLGTGGDIGVGRTDTIMLLHIPTTGQARLVSLPRDSYVTIPGYGDDKINAAFTYGGPKLLTSTVGNATVLRVDNYAEIGMGGLANVVDAVGGVELCPAEPINDPLANLDVQAGCQEMDGTTALGYV